MVVRAIMLSAIVLASGCAAYPAPEKPVPSVPPVHGESLPVVPDGGYTWQQLVKLAITANPDYAAILAEARAEYFRYKSKTAPKEPEFSFEASFLSDEKRIDKYSAGISFSIPNPFVNRQVIRTGEAARRETETGAEALRNEIASTVYELVQEILTGERQLSILSLREQVFSDRAAHIKMRYDAHVATQADMREFDIQRLRLKAAVQQARLGTHAARRSLQVLVQIPDEQLVLNTSPSDWKAVLAVLEDKETLIGDALSRSAELAGAYAAYGKAGAMLDTARARQIPWVNSVFFSYNPSFTESTGYNNSGVFIPSQKTNSWTFGVDVNLPVFAWFSSEKKMAAAEIEAASLRITGISQRIRNEIAGIVAELRDALNSLADYQSAYDSIPEPTREAIPDTESYYKLLDARLSASGYALEFELKCAKIYSEFLMVTGGWE